ncbi:MAG: PAS domain-containing protein [Pseudomonadota bacterium]
MPQEAAKSLSLSPLLQRVHSGWRQACGAAQLPMRSALDPRDFGADVGAIWVAERRSSDDFRFRVSGHVVGRIMGMEMRGMPAVSIIEPEDRQAMSELLITSCAQRMVAHVCLQSDHGTPHQSTLLLMPMLGPTGKVDRILGALDVDCDALPPNRFRILQTKLFPASAGSHAIRPQDKSNANSLKVIHGGRATRSAPRAKLRLVS